MTYILLTAEIEGRRVSRLIEEGQFDSPPEDYFLTTAEDVQNRGKVEITGEAEMELDFEYESD